MSLSCAGSIWVVKLHWKIQSTQKEKYIWIYIYVNGQHTVFIGFLFHDTIKENLLVGKNFSDEQIARAIGVAYADEFISKLPDGVDTVIGDRGTRLSGGQQQRLTRRKRLKGKSKMR